MEMEKGEPNETEKGQPGRPEENEENARVLESWGR